MNIHPVQGHVIPITAVEIIIAPEDCSNAAAIVTTAHY